MSDPFYYTIDDMYSYLHDITRTMHLDQFQPDFVVGIARGGLVPATFLSHYFNCKMLTLSLSLRDNKVEPNNQILDFIADQVEKNDSKVLIVDDICDSGLTLEEVFEYLYRFTATKRQNYRSAVLVHNLGEKRFIPKYRGMEINKNKDDRWIIFPWENWWQM